MQPINTTKIKKTFLKNHKIPYKKKERYVRMNNQDIIVLSRTS